MGMKDSLDAFVTDVKKMIKEKDISTVNEKYLQPSWEKTKGVAQKTWEVVAENTPKVVAAGKEVAHKVQEMIQERSKKTAAASEEKPQTSQDPSSTPSDSADSSKPNKNFSE